MVATKLKTCSQIIEAVNAFHHHHFSSTKKGLIDLDFDEARFLDKSLKAIKLKLGKILYVASKDGDEASKFHSACDNQGPTVTIVQSTSGNVFGGYTDVNWGGRGGFYFSRTSFLFRLRPALKKYAIRKGQETNAVFRSPKAGPAFGRGIDLAIADEALSNSNSYTRGGTTYNFPGKPSYELNDGLMSFRVKDYVVLKAIQL
jgi:hypothetical protein